MYICIIWPRGLNDNVCDKLLISKSDVHSIVQVKKNQITLRDGVFIPSTW